MDKIYCDNCGHSFNTPETILGYPTCPKCSSKDIQTLKPEEDDELPTSDPATRLADRYPNRVFTTRPLDSRFHSAKP